MKVFSAVMVMWTLEIQDRFGEDGALPPNIIYYEKLWY